VLNSFQLHLLTAHYNEIDAQYPLVPLSLVMTILCLHDWAKLVEAGPAIMAGSAVAICNTACNAGYVTCIWFGGWYDWASWLVVLLDVLLYGCLCCGWFSYKCCSNSLIYLWTRVVAEGNLMIIFSSTFL
jgi:hypothetical protein